MKFVTNPSLISRIHFAKWLADIKAVNSIDAAFEKYIGSGRACFVPLNAPTIPEAVRLIKGAGGIPVLPTPDVMVSKIGSCRLSLMNSEMPEGRPLR